MRRALRFLVLLTLVLATIAYGVVPLVDELTLRWFVRDLDIRAPGADRAVEFLLSFGPRTVRVSSC